MNKYPGIPELLEQFMEEQGADERWVTVQEIRDRFGLTRYHCSTVSGFLHRLHHGTFGQFPYIVLKRERISLSAASDARVHRYLLKKRHNNIPTLSQDLVSSACDTP
jgi:hypothetical protein